jgi:UDP-N-acetylmuramate dehydrogenase
MHEVKDQLTVPMQQVTTFRIGGRPLLYSRPRTQQELQDELQECREAALPLRILGGGSNLLVADGELPFAVIHLCSPGFDWIERTGSASVRVGAGVRLGQLLIFCREAGLGGLEFLAGIPGTVGGAIAGNAGAWGLSMGQRIARVWTLSPGGRPAQAQAERLAFQYRRSSLRGNIVTEAELTLEPRSPALIGGLIKRNLKRKAGRQPTGQPNAGCVFKNPPGASAGRLLDLCGMKGRRLGDAEVSRVHANFICNVGNARARDVIGLMDIMRRAVLRSFGIELSPELTYWSRQKNVA